MKIYYIYAYHGESSSIIVSDTFPLVSIKNKIKKESGVNCNFIYNYNDPFYNVSAKYIGSFVGTRFTKSYPDCSYQDKIDNWEDWGYESKADAIQSDIDHREETRFINFYYDIYVEEFMPNVVYNT